MIGKAFTSVLDWFLGDAWRLLAIVFGIAFVIAWTGWEDAERDAKTAHALAEAAKAKAAQRLAEQRAEFERQAREAESRQRAALDAVEAIYEKEKDDAVAKERAVADDLRAGNLRLRQHWRDYVTTAELSQAAGAAAVADEGARLREQGAAALVRVAADADAHIRGLQAALNVCTGKEPAHGDPAQ